MQSVLPDDSVSKVGADYYWEALIERQAVQRDRHDNNFTDIWFECDDYQPYGNECVPRCHGSYPDYTCDLERFPIMGCNCYVTAGHYCWADTCQTCFGGLLGICQHSCCMIPLSSCCPVCGGPCAPGGDGSGENK